MPTLYEVNDWTPEQLKRLTDFFNETPPSMGGLNEEQAKELTARLWPGEYSTASNYVPAVARYRSEIPNELGSIVSDSRTFSVRTVKWDEPGVQGKLMAYNDRELSGLRSFKKYMLAHQGVPFSLYIWTLQGEVPTSFFQAEIKDPIAEEQGMGVWHGVELGVI